MQNKIKLTSNMEDYLEVIGLLHKAQGVARVKDIGHLMCVKTPSVTSALNTLSQKGLIVHERYGYIQFTPEGERLANKIQARHDLLTRFLNEVLNVDKEIAGADACKMEHVISPQTYQRLNEFIEFIDQDSGNSRPEWLKKFERYVKTNKKS